MKPQTSVLVVSYYRTGKHWLSMLMELCFGGPVLPDAFYYPDVPPVAHHTHASGEECNIEPLPQTIYLYRDPVDTIFSQSLMDYYNWNTDVCQIQYHARIYGRHLAMWLCSERVSSLTTIRHECMREDFPRICVLYGQECSKERLDCIFAQATKEEMVERMVNIHARSWMARTDRGYAEMRIAFREQFAGLVWKTVLGSNLWLLSYFDHLPEEKQWIP